MYATYWVRPNGVLDTSLPEDKNDLMEDKVSLYLSTKWVGQLQN